MEPKRCACGVELQEWKTEGSHIWAATLPDVTAYQKGQSTRHDIINARGRRVRIGQCEGKAPYGRPLL